MGIPDLIRSHGARDLSEILFSVTGSRQELGNRASVSESLLSQTQTNKAKNKLSAGFEED